MRCRRTAILLSALLALGASRCAPFKTQVVNETGEQIDVVVTFASASPPAYGPLPRGGVLNLEEEPSSINEIRYRYGSSDCLLKHQSFGPTVNLRRC
jgi:hypothetical protein